MGDILIEITNYLVGQSWQIALLAVVIAAVSLAVKNKSAHVQYLLWLIVLAKCLAPPLYRIPLAVLPERGVAEPVVTSAVEAPALSLELVEAVQPRVFETPVVVSEPVVRLGIAERLAEVTIGEWLGFGWILGAGVFVVVALIKAWRTNQWLRGARMALPARLESRIEELFAELGVRRVPRVWLIKGVGQPFVWGLLRGSIYLPGNFDKVNGGKGRRGVLGHELSHVLRYDAAVNVLQIIAQAVYWFHPFVWWANKKIRAEREKCCDEMAIARLKAVPKDYSTAIVNTLIAEHKSARPVPSLAVAGPVKNIEDRIKTIMRSGKKFYRRPTFVTIVTVVLLAALAVPTTLALTRQAAEKGDDIGRAVIEGIRANRDKFECGVLAWSGKTINDRYADSNRPGRELAGDYELWWEGNKMATKYVREAVHKDPTGRYWVEKEQGGNSYDGSLLSRKPRFDGPENWLGPSVTRWRGEGSHDWMILGENKLEDIRKDWSVVDANGTKLIRLITKNMKETDQDYGAYSVRYYDPSKGHGLVNEEWYNPDGSPRLKHTVRMLEVVPGGWFPFEVDFKHLAITDGRLINHNHYALDIERCSFNDKSALPKGIFKLGMEKQLKYQEKLQKYLAMELRGLSDVKEAAKADKVKLGAREAIESFVAAAMVGDLEKAGEYAHPDRLPANHIAQITEIAKGQNLWIMAVVADDWSAIAVSSVIQGDHSRVGPLVFSLDRVVVDGRDNWWVHDIDMVTPDRAERDLKGFLEKYPQAKRVAERGRRVRDLFRSYVAGETIGEEDKAGSEEAPRFGWSDIPILLELAESDKVVEGKYWKDGREYLRSLPMSSISSYLQGQVREGMVALWLIEGLRRGQGRPGGHYRLPLNPICLKKGMSREECEKSAEIYRDVLHAYRRWWQQVSLLPAEEAALPDPLEDRDVQWIGGPWKKADTGGWGEAVDARRVRKVVSKTGDRGQEAVDSNDAGPQFLSEIHLVRVDLNSEEIREFLEREGTGLSVKSGYHSLGSRQVEEFLELVEVTAGCRRLASPKVLTNNGQTGTIEIRHEPRDVRDRRGTDEPKGKPDEVKELEAELTAKWQPDSENILLMVDVNYRPLIGGEYRYEVPRAETMIATKTQVAVKSGETILLGGIGSWGDKTKEGESVLVLITCDKVDRGGRDRGESAERLHELALAVKMYADDHEAGLPDTLRGLKAYMGEEQDFEWVVENVAYLGKGKNLNVRGAGRVPVAYDKTLVERADGTNVLFLDFSVRFLPSTELEGLGISSGEMRDTEDERGWGAAVEGVRCRWVGPVKAVAAGTAPVIALEVENVSDNQIIWQCRSEHTWRIYPRGSEGKGGGVYRGTYSPKFRVVPGEGVRLAGVDEARRNHEGAGSAVGYYGLAPGARMRLISEYLWVLPQAGQVKVDGYLNRRNPGGGGAYPAEMLLRNRISCPPLVLEVTAGDPAAERAYDIVWSEPLDGLQAGIKYEYGKRLVGYFQDVELSIVMRNITEEAIAVTFSPTGHYDDLPRVCDKRGRQQRVEMASDYEKYPPDTVTFSPGFTGSIDVVAFAVCPKDYSGEERRGPILYADPGKYTIIRVFRYNLDGDKELNKELTVGPIDLEVVSPGEQPRDVSWGEVVEGVQIRLRGERLTWREGETPQFKVDVRNDGSHKLQLAYGPTYWEVEVDGLWYRAAIPMLGDLIRMTFGPDQQHYDLPLSLDTRFGWRSGHKVLELTPGRHTVRAALARELSEDGRPVSLRAVSNAVEIEILPRDWAGQSEDEILRKFFNQTDSQIQMLKGKYPQLADWNRAKTAANGYSVGKEITEERLVYNHVAFPGRSPGYKDWCGKNGCHIQIKRDWGLESPYMKTRIFDLKKGRLSVFARVITGNPEAPELEHKINDIIQSAAISAVQKPDVQVEDETGWGAAVGGVQCRLRAAKVEWQVGERPTLKADIRNLGAHQLHVVRHQGLCEVWVDGRWYGWAGEIGAKSSPLGPGREYNDIGISLDEHWVTMTKGRPLRPRRRHTVRVAFTPQSKQGEVIRVHSNPVEIEILPGEGGGGSSGRGAEREAEARRAAGGGRRRRIVFLGLDLTDAPRRSSRGELGDLFEERPVGSGSYALRQEVVAARHPEFWESGVIYYVAAKKQFYIIAEPGHPGSGSKTFYGPFAGQPWKRFGMGEPRPPKYRHRFAIYLVVDPVDVGCPENVALERLRLASVPLLTEEDIVEYDWNEHFVKLTPDARRRVPSPRSVWGLPFVVVADGERCYLGAFWSFDSSYMPKVPVIYGFYPGGRENKIQISPPRGDDIKDPRNDPRIRKALEKPYAIGADKTKKRIGRHPASAAVYEQLDQIVDLSGLGPEMLFGDGLEELRRSVRPRLNIVVLWRDLEKNADVDRATPINMGPIPAVRLGTALELLLRSVSAGIAELGYVVQDGVIVIATKESLPKNLETRVYDVSVLVGRPANFYGSGMGMGMIGGMGYGGGYGGYGGYGGGGYGGNYEPRPELAQKTAKRAEEVIKLIHETVEPNSWWGAGGEGTITTYDNRKLIILQTVEFHEKIEKLLGKMRKAMSRSVAIETRFIGVAADSKEVGDFLKGVEDIGIIPIDAKPKLAHYLLGDEEVSELLELTSAGPQASMLTAPKITIVNGETASFSVATGKVGEMGEGIDPERAGRGFREILKGMFCVTPNISADKKEVLLSIARKELVGYKKYVVERPLAGGGVAKEEQEVPEFESELYTRVSVPVGKTLLIRGKGHWIPEHSGLVGRELLVLMKAEIVEGEVNELSVRPALR